MDDIYFSDKKKSDKNGKSQQRERISADKPVPKKSSEIISENRKKVAAEKAAAQKAASQKAAAQKAAAKKTESKNSFMDKDYSDENFSLDFKTKTPEYKPYGSSEPELISSSRTPAGKRVASSPAPSRAPQGKRVTSSRAPQGKKKKNRSGKAKVVIGLVTLVLLFVACIGVYGISALSGINYEERGENKHISQSELVSSPDVKNILFVGCDARGDVVGNRSDTMILFSLDQKNRKIKLTSFLRDSYVYIPQKGYSNKLNAAFSYGGQEGLIDTLEYNFKIKIDNYVMVDFNAFRQLVNLLGGITVDGVTETEAKYMREAVKIPEVKAGTNVMNGKTALWYCRIRYIDNDFRRTERQRKVISAIISKVARTDIFTLIDICKQVLPNVSTDISTTELMGLAVNAALRYMWYDIEQQQIPADGEWSDRWVGSQQVVALDFEANRKILKKFLYE